MRKYLLVIAPLCLGAFIYWVRPLFVPWSYVRNFVPDACWAFSFTYAFFLLWKGELSLAIRMIPILLFLAFEFMQKFEIITGTFDLIDCLAYILSYLLASVIFRYYEQEKDI